MGQTTGRAKGKERSSQLQWPTEQDNWAPSSIGLLRKSFVHNDLVRVFKHSECYWTLKSRCLPKQKKWLVITKFLKADGRQIRKWKRNG